MAEHAAADNVHTRRIAAFVSGLGYETIPAEVRERLKLLILDSLGCAIYGAIWNGAASSGKRSNRSTRRASTSIWGTVGGSRRRTLLWSTARRCKASNSTTCTAKASCMSAR